ncbi:MAG: 30S ribosomal protein S6 [Patescibacteria group bacterium]
MKQFELMFTLGEDLTEPKARTVAGEINKLIEKHTGKVTHHVFWGKKKMTYQIEKNTYGYYFISIFDIDGPAIEALTKEINMDERVIRYLITDFYKDTELPVERGLERDPEAGKKEGKEGKEEGKKDEKKVAKKEVKEVIAEITPEAEVATEEPEVAQEVKEEAAVKTEKATKKSTEEKMKEIEDEQARKRMMDEETRKAELEKRIAEM